MQDKYTVDNIKTIKLILVDDNLSFRSALGKLLKIQYACNIIAEASNGAEFLNLQCISDADLIFMDLMMPVMDGFKAARQINIQEPSLKIIAVTMHYEKVYLNELIKNGFKGCLFKTTIFEKIIDAIITVMNGNYFFPDEIKNVIPEK